MARGPLLRLVSAGLVAALTGCAPPPAPIVPPEPAPPASVAPSASPAPPLAVVPPPPDLPVIDYWPSPVGFPADPSPLSRERLTEGLRPGSRLAVYDAPGGLPRAYLDPTIRGVGLTLPIVERRSDWVAVLLPSVNRSVGWLPPGGWTTVPLRDQLLVDRSAHELRWLRDGRLVRSWVVTVGLDATPTPLGRTFVLGRTGPTSYVYGGTDIFALGAVPDDPDAVPPGLRGAHIGLHTWYHDGELGRNTTDGCIRLTRSGQQQLLDEIVPGTEVLVVDHLKRAR